MFNLIFFRYQDENTQAFFMVVSCSRWFGFRLDLLSSVFITIVAVAAILITESSGELIPISVVPFLNKQCRYANGVITYNFIALVFHSICWTCSNLRTANFEHNSTWCTISFRSGKLDDVSGTCHVVYSTRFRGRLQH